MNESRRKGFHILPVGFATTIAMWTVGYACRLPGAAVPGWLVLLLLVGCMLLGGFASGRYGGDGWRGGASAGALSALLNLLLVGSLVAGSRPNAVVPSALWWIPGTLAAGVLLGAAGAAIGSRRPSPSVPRASWTGAFAAVAATAVLILLVVGGVVTSQDAGLAVVDWPNSYGYGMFLYPLSRMTGGIYYEHAHRLFGSLAGLTTLVLAILLHRVDRRRGVRLLADAAVVLVVVQGLLGGLRVTGTLTLSQSPAATAPKIALAVVHGVLGQLFFSTMVAVAAVTSGAWRSLAASGGPRRTARGDRALAAILFGLLLVQVALGAVQRHLARGLMIHVAVAAIVTLVVVICGVRAWGVYAGRRVVQRTGLGIVVITGLQLLLGGVALMAVSASPDHRMARGLEVLVTTAHQATGAVLLAASLVLFLWFHRLATTSPPGTPPAS